MTPTIGRPALDRVEPGYSRSIPIVEFDFVPLQGTPDPYPVYDAMREAGRVLRSPFGALMVHRYEDVRLTHGDHDAFSMAAIDTTAMAGSMGERAEAGPGMNGDEFMMAQTMLTTDPPDHERLRRVVNRAFTPKSIAAIEPRVREIAARVAGAARPRRAVRHRRRLRRVPFRRS